ncbi:MAG: AzlD domain-containing protein [Pseudomonadota bacterium]
MDTEFLIIILISAVVTFGLRSGGYVILSRFRSIPARVEAGLDAVPAAVITAMVTPAATSGEWQEAAAMGLAALLSLRFSLPVVVFVPVAALALARLVT